MFVSRLDSSRLGVGMSGASGGSASGVRQGSNATARVAEAGTQTDPLPAEVVIEAGSRPNDMSRIVHGADPAYSLAKMVEPWQLRWVAKQTNLSLN